MTFDSIYNEHYKKVYNWINYKINDQEAAEELAADIFVKVHKNLNDFDESKSKMGTWIMSITKNAIIDFFRTNKAGLFVSIEELEQKDDEDHKMEQRVFIDQQNPESLMVNNQIGAAVANAINELPVAQATIADMFLVQEMSHEEISADLNVPIGTVKGTIHRAKKALQNRLLNLR